MTRFFSIVSIAAAVVACVISWAPGQSLAQQRRALVIGINEYAPVETATGVSLRKWKNLDGAVNDAEAMALILEAKFDFDEVTTLYNAAATREAIFQAIEEQLVARTEPGDIVVFYYAGHGSQVRNTASSETDGLDETIVPADVAEGADDIRDKELRDAFNTILDRGAELTLIFDSCHSGSITRGIPGGKTRFIEPSNRVISDPSDPPSPVERGALVLSAAQDDELASEIVDDTGLPRGAFSWALQQALTGSGAKDPVATLFLRIRAILRSAGMTQEPVLAGAPVRRNQALFGSNTRSASPAEVVVLGSDDTQLVLQGGLALGLRPGTELIYSLEKGGNGERYIIVRADGLSRAYADPVVSGPLPAPGSILTVERWMPGTASPMHLYVPPAMLTYDSLRVAANVFESLKTRSGIHWIVDPTVETADHIIFYDHTWRMLTSEGSVVTLGDQPNPERVLGALLPASEGNDVFLFVDYPPFKAFGISLLNRLDGPATTARLVQDESTSDYTLVGRRANEQFTYAWVFREATSTASSSPAPPRTDWRPATDDRLIAADLLVRDVSRLDAVWGWLHLESPPNVGAFPYRFTGFENTASGVLLSSGDTLLVGDQYRLVLESTTKKMQDAQMQAVINDSGKQYIYVFAIDRNGNGALLYPNAGIGNGENEINLFTGLPMRLTIPATGYLFTVTPPTGVDSFFVLSSAEPLPQPSILTFSGVRTRGPATGEQSELSRLLYSLGNGSRGTIEAVPTNWSVDRMSVQSMEEP